MQIFHISSYHKNMVYLNRGFILYTDMVYSTNICYFHGSFSLENKQLSQRWKFATKFHAAYNLLKRAVTGLRLCFSSSKHFQGKHLNC